MEEVIGSIPIRSTKISIEKSMVYVGRLSIALPAFGVNWCHFFLIAGSTGTALNLLSGDGWVTLGDYAVRHASNQSSA